MRCINKKRRRKKRNLKPLFLLVLLIGAGVLAVFLWKGQSYVLRYEKENYNGTLYCAELPVDSLCVSTNDILHSAFQTEADFHAISFMNLKEGKILHAESIHEKLYPASTTKLMTAYLALKYGALDSEVVVTANAQDIPIDSSRAGLRIGDKMTLLDLLHGLLLPSGNDAAVAVAEHISGSVDEFVTLMNTEAQLLGATNSHFVNPHGYQHEDHYTTAYDLYLIFEACMDMPEFKNIISSASHELEITQQNGTYRIENWRQSNWYVNGYASEPAGLTAIGGKTGTTDEAGSCLVTLFEDTEGTPYLAVIMGAENRSVLYDNMNLMITSTLQ